MFDACMHARNMNACASGCRHRMNNWHLPRGKLTSIRLPPPRFGLCMWDACIHAKPHAYASHAQDISDTHVLRGSHNLRKPVTGTAGQVFRYVRADVIRPPVWSATLIAYRVQDLSLIYHYPPEITHHLPRPGPKSKHANIGHIK